MDIGRGDEASKSDESGIGEHSLRQPELGEETSESTYPGGGIGSNSFSFNPDVVVSDERQRLSSSSSSSSSSSGSSMDDQFQVNTNVPESSKPDDHDETLTQSPPVQVMDRVGEFDPYRIPSSVFARSKTIAPADWSATSNDSLFSISVEDNSLPRDHALLSFKAGEIVKSGELFTINQSPLPFGNESAEIDKREANLMSGNTLKDETRPSDAEPIGEKATPPTRFLNASTRSDYSDDTAGTSVHSFAFPVLDGGKNVVTKEQKREQQKQSQQQQQERHEQEEEEEEPLAPAASSKWCCCCNCCSWFDGCQCQWRCWNWHWCCSSSSCCREKSS